MKKLNFWMLACILFCGLTLTGCKNDDNPAFDGPGDDNTPSNVDNGTWPDLSQYMDTSVNPGDDFFMYCNGTWWKNTTVPTDVSPEYERIGYTINLAQEFTKKAEALELPSKTKFLTDFDKMNQTSTQSQTLYDKVLQESGLEAATTKEEAWKAAARLAKAGADMMIEVCPFSKGGTIRLYVDYSDIVYMDGIITDDDSDKEKGRHPRRSKTNNAAFISSLQPVGSSTRSVSATEWPFIVTYIKELGLNPEEVYCPSEYMAQRGGDPNSDVVNLVNTKLREIQELEVNDFKLLVKDYYAADSAFISEGALANLNKELAKKGRVRNKKTVESYIEKNYLGYELSKEVGEKLVTADDILHGEQAVQELKDVFTERIKNNSWLSAGSKQNALEKLNNMAVNVGRPDKWMAEALPNIQSCTSVLEDLFSLRKSRLNGVLALNGKPAKQYGFHAMFMGEAPITLDIANAFYDPNFNSINLWPFYITAPWYSASQNSAINYETYNTFGHEITHGFDTDGSKFDKNGDPKPLWANQADSEEFNRRAQQLIDWYSTFDLLPDAPGLKANAKVTIAEDIADLGGMELAFQCYNNYLDKNGFKGEQKQLQLERYFYAYAQEFRSKYSRRFIDYTVFGLIDGLPSSAIPDSHSMDKERVNGLLPNCDGWYNTFNITSGKLYRKPSERVRIW